MNKYLIKREIEGASQIPSDKLNEIGQGSESVLIAMRKEEKKLNRSIAILLGIMFFVSIMQNLRT